MPDLRHGCRTEKPEVPAWIREPAHESSEGKTHLHSVVEDGIHLHTEAQSGLRSYEVTQI